MTITKRERLQRRIANAEKALAHKRAVQARHAPGTPWYTRARLEADAYERRIARLCAELESLGD
jgi:hypothetical protein